jgi:hypothetical protein
MARRRREDLMGSAWRRDGRRSGQEAAGTAAASCSTEGSAAPTPTAKPAKTDNLCARSIFIDKTGIASVIPRAVCLSARPMRWTVLPE